MFMKFFSDNRFFALSLIGAIIYSSVMISQTIVNPDTQFIFPILENIKGVFNYFDYLIGFRTLDFQPVRYLSLYIDLFVFNSTGFNITIFYNVLLWVSSCYILVKNLSKSEILLITAFFYLIHFLLKQLLGV
jgi:hypothetical protein